MQVQTIKTDSPFEGSTDTIDTVRCFTGNPAKLVTLHDHVTLLLYVNFDPRREFLVSLVSDI